MPKWQCHSNNFEGVLCHLVCRWLGLARCLCFRALGSGKASSLFDRPVLPAGVDDQSRGRPRVALESSHPFRVLSVLECRLQVAAPFAMPPPSGPADKVCKTKTNGLSRLSLQPMDYYRHLVLLASQTLPSRPRRRRWTWRSRLAMIVSRAGQILQKRGPRSPRRSSPPGRAGLCSDG